ncbi:MAG: prepilin-type N-terminal cleavage/methylation domain-containing protein [Burkholderiales bacterium]|jgi:type IV pilus assembly protein PilV|nr:prepilin-type N-terminal cleavage/methylation domain-containing protein [Burkholderiales bacterium]
MKSKVALKLPSRHAGATLVEVLVSILILSFSLLGIAGLLSVTTRYQLGVESRAAATMLLNESTSRLRANLNEALMFTTTIPTYAYADSWNTQQAAITAAAKNCGSAATTTCTTAERAAYDLWEMRSMARRSLPQGSMQLSGTPVDGMTVTYLWFDKEYADTSLVTTANPSGLKTSATCATTQSPIQLLSCCPAAASVSSTPGVRCLNLTFIP